MAYVTNAKVMGGLKKLRAGGSTTTDGSFLLQHRSAGHWSWPHASDPERLPDRRHQRDAFQPDQGFTSSSVCSALVAGDFSQAMLGFYGNGLEITVGKTPMTSARH